MLTVLSHTSHTSVGAYATGEKQQLQATQQRVTSNINVQRYALTGSYSASADSVAPAPILTSTSMCEVEAVPAT